MKTAIKTVMTSTIAMALISFGANAADQGQGVVKFEGSVINAPCSIAPESADQTIDFGQISKYTLNNDGISVKKDLDIKLLNCEADSTVKVTFKGGQNQVGGPELGTAGNTGTAVVISGQDGKMVEFGSAGAGQRLTTGNNILHYSSWVKKATGVTEVTEGSFNAVATFKLDYE